MIGRVFTDLIMTINYYYRYQISDNIVNGSLFSAVCGVALLFSPCGMQAQFGGRLLAGAILLPLHSMLFLPVLASILGPRRTVWPRVYVSQSSKGDGSVPTTPAPQITPAAPALSTQTCPQTTPTMRAELTTPPTPVIDDDRKHISFILPGESSSTRTSICPIAELDDNLSVADTDVDDTDDLVF